MLAVGLSPSNARVHPLTDHCALELGEHACVVSTSHNLASVGARDRPAGHPGRWVTTHGRGRNWCLRPTGAFPRVLQEGAKPRPWFRHYGSIGSDLTHACGHQESPASAGLSLQLPRATKWSLCLRRYLGASPPPFAGSLVNQPDESSKAQSGSVNGVGAHSRTLSSPLAGILMRTCGPRRKRSMVSAGHLYDARSNRRRAASSYSDPAIAHHRLAMRASTTNSDVSIPNSLSSFRQKASEKFR